MRPRGEDDAYTILLDPSRISADFGWDVTVPLEQGVAARDRLLPRVRDRRDLHAPAGRRMTEGSLERSADPRRRRRRLRRLQSRPGASGRRSRARSSSSTTCSPASARTCPTIPRSTFIEGSITDDATLGSASRRARLRVPPRHLSRQPELDGRPARRSRAQHALDAAALRGDQGLDGVRARRLRVGRLHRRREDVRRRRGDDRGRARSRCGSTARTRSRRSSASTTRTTTSPGTACRRSRPASRTSTGPARSSAPAAGAGRSTPSGATSCRRSSTRRCTTRRCRSRTAASPRATSSTSATWRRD